MVVTNALSRLRLTRGHVKYGRNHTFAVGRNNIVPEGVAGCGIRLPLRRVKRTEVVVLQGIVHQVIVVTGPSLRQVFYRACNVPVGYIQQG